MKAPYTTKHFSATSFNNLYAQIFKLHYTYSADEWLAIFTILLLQATVAFIPCSKEGELQLKYLTNGILLSTDYFQQFTLKATI